jgi:hypothetical protein
MRWRACPTAIKVHERSYGAHNLNCARVNSMGGPREKFKTILYMYNHVSLSSWIWCTKVKCYKACLIYMIYVTLYLQRINMRHFVNLLSFLRTLMHKMFYLSVYNKGSSHELLPCGMHLLIYGLTPSTSKILFYC